MKRQIINIKHLQMNLGQTELVLEEITRYFEVLTHHEHKIDSKDLKKISKLFSGLKVLMGIEDWEENTNYTYSPWEIQRQDLLNLLEMYEKCDDERDAQNLYLLLCFLVRQVIKLSEERQKDEIRKALKLSRYKKTEVTHE